MRGTNDPPTGEPGAATGVGDVRHYLFCPAIIAAKRVGAAEPPAERLSDARELPEEVAKRFAEVRREVPLSRPPFRGVVDYLAVDPAGYVVPIEVKASQGRPTQAGVYQLAAYMWLAESVAPVKYGLLVKDAVYQISYTPELREALLHLAEKVIAVYRGADPPYTTGRCHICGYAPHCLYKPQRLQEKGRPRHT